MAASKQDTIEPTPEQREDWEKIQGQLRRKMILDDTEAWAKQDEFDGLHYVAGADISFFKDDNQCGYATLAIIEYTTKKLIHSVSKRVKLKTPYCPGFLAFREAEWYTELMEEFTSQNKPFQPQLIMVDGSGTLHPNGFGSACHLGVLLGIPTIGVCKNYLSMNGEDPKAVKQRAKCELKLQGDSFNICCKVGEPIAVALRSSSHGDNPIYVSPGHRISLTTAVEVVKHMCKYRIPEPIRQADMISGELVRNEVSKGST